MNINCLLHKTYASIKSIETKIWKNIIGNFIIVEDLRNNTILKNFLHNNWELCQSLNSKKFRVWKINVPVHVLKYIVSLLGSPKKEWI